MENKDYVQHTDVVESTMNHILSRLKFQIQKISEKNTNIVGDFEDIEISDPNTANVFGRLNVIVSIGNVPIEIRADVYYQMGDHTYCIEYEIWKCDRYGYNITFSVKKDSPTIPKKFYLTKLRAKMYARILTDIVAAQLKELIKEVKYDRTKPIDS